MDRKLAAILAVDVVGYTAHMERDEQGTYQRLVSGRKELFEPEIAKHHGRVFKLMGDGLLAEFASVVDAVECGVALQRGLAERNAAVSEPDRIQVRMGINLGEVIVEGDDCYGEGVNIATRLEQIAEPGSIYVSGKVAKEVEKKLAFRFEPMGQQKMKNLTEPVAVFRIRTGDQPRSLNWRHSTYRKLARWAGAIALLAVIVAAATWLYFEKLGDSSRAAGTRMPSIAVLAFEPMGSNSELGYLGDGVSEDIISMLARSPDVSVVARNSSFTYKGKPTDVRQIGKDLDVDYVLEGSVRVDAQNMRIIAQLISTKTGDHVWADRFDKAGSDPWILQDEIARKIIVSLTGEAGSVKQAQYRDAWGKDTASLGEYDYYLRGHDMLMHTSKEDTEKAGAIWREGLKKYPGSALLTVKLGFYHFIKMFSFWSDNPTADIDRAVDLARESLSGDNVSPQVKRLAHWLLSRALSVQGGQSQSALREADIALKLAPYDDSILGDVALTMIENGQPERAITMLTKVLEDDPGRRPEINYKLGWAYTTLGDGPKALASLQEAWEGADVPLLKAINYVRMNKIDAAKAEVAKSLAQDPLFTCKKWTVGYVYSDPKILQGQLDDLKKAGLPCGDQGS